MNIKKIFIVVLTLTVIQLSIIRASDQQNESVSEINERLDSLEMSTQYLRSVFDNAIRIIAAQISNPKNFVRNFTSTVDDIKSELEILKQTVEVQKNSQQLLLAEIADDIKSRDFENAARKLRNLNGDLKKNINFIVHEVYNNQAGNFKLIIMFGQYKDIDIATNVAVYEALSFEMESNNHNDFLKVFELISSFENRFRGTGEDPVVFPIEASEFIRKHNEIMVKVAEGELLKAIKSNNFDVVNEIFEKIGVEKLINLLRSYKYSPKQSILVYSAIFNGLKKSDLNQPSVVSLAFALKEALNDTSIDQDSRDLGEIMKEELPDSVKNLAFAQSVCIASAFYIREPLFAATDTLSNRPSIFTWIKGDSVENYTWLIEQRGDVYYIKNKNYGKYMYENQEDGNLAVHIGIPESTNSNFKWVFQPNGRYVYIKHFDNYLHPSNKTFELPGYNKCVRGIYDLPAEDSAKPQKDTIDDNLWLINDCSISE